MIFQTEGQFQQFPHCKFRENIVRLLFVPSILENNDTKKLTDEDERSTKESGSQTHYCFMAVSKFGKIGLYHSEKFSLLHTYCLDLSAPMHPRTSKSLTILAQHRSSSNAIPPRCEKTHLILDAVFSPDTLCIIFATTKNILQWYDIGEIQKLNIGLELFPRKEFMGLLESDFPVSVPNKGHVECHRLFELNSMPSCLDYYCGPSQVGKLFIGDVEGGITIIFVPNPRSPLGRRKIRGKLHRLVLSELVKKGICRYYKAHHEPVTDIHFISERDLILTCSRDKKFSIFVKDIMDTVDSIIVSIPKGVNALSHSSTLKMIATGSDDYVVRLFSQFIMKMPQMELLGHRSPVLAVEFVQVDFMENPILLSYSADSELRAWDPLTFICLQSLYLTFPIGSTIICKTPEFARKSLRIHQPQSVIPESTKKAYSWKNPTTTRKRMKIGTQHQLSINDTCSRPNGSGNGNGTIILLYCNSYARIPMERNRGSSGKWPFDFDEFIQEFEELSVEYDKKLKERLKRSPEVVPQKEGEEADERLVEAEKQSMMESRDILHNLQQISPTPNKQEKVQISLEEVSEIESKLDEYVKEILELKRTIKSNGRKGSPVDDFKLLKATSTPSASNTGRLTESSVEEHSLFPAAVFDISVEATHRFYEFKRQKVKTLPKNLRRMVTFGQAFNHHPIADLEPIQFTKKNLVIPEKMKTTLGLQSVNSIDDLLTSEAQKYFGIDSSTHGRSSNGKQKKLKDKSRKARGLHLSQPSSRFTVVGHKIHNAYDEDTSCMQGNDQHDNDSDDVEGNYFH